jgi:hypothetical protein
MTDHMTFDGCTIKVLYLLIRIIIVDSKLRILILSTALFIILMISSSNLFSVRAHTFSPNESASFLSLVDQIKSALVPIKEDVSSNITITKEQAQYARSLLTENVTKELKERNQRISTELTSMLDSLQNISSKDVNGNLSNLNNILAEAITVRVEKDQLHNVTVQATAFAIDINKILDDYTAAVRGRNVSEHSTMNLSNMSSISMNKNINMSAYQRASALVDIASDRFNTELKGKSNATSTMEQVIKGLEQLKMAIRDIVSIDNVMGIVHGQIHPNLQTAFGLQLAQSTHGNGKMSMSMSMSNMNNTDQSKHNTMTNMS